MSSISSQAQSFLVVGATGATGRHVVAQLLQSPLNHQVRVIVRSADRMRQILSDHGVPETSRLEITQAPLLDLSDEQLLQHTANVDVVISCLGHTLNWNGIFGHPRDLVREATRRLTTALQQNQQQEQEEEEQQQRKEKNGKKCSKFVLMGSDGVTWHGHDNVRPWMERFVLWLLRNLVPPHCDNEMAAAYLLSLASSQNNTVEWVIVRPTDLIDDDPASTAGAARTYQLYPKPQGSLFGSGTATRSHVAKAMVELATSPSLWNQWKFQMPVLVDDAPASKIKTKLDTKKSK